MDRMQQLIQQHRLDPLAHPSLGSPALPIGAATEAKQDAEISVLETLSTEMEAVRDRLPSALSAGGNLRVSLAESTAPQSVMGTVSIASLPVATWAGQTPVTYDYDTGSGTQTIPIVGIAVPASGGAVPGGTSTAPIRVDPTGTTAQPASQSGAWSVGQTGAWTVSISGTTAVSATSLPLPSGAATAAKQPALGTAGTPSADVITVQGAASGQSIPVSLSGTMSVNWSQVASATAGSATLGGGSAKAPLVVIAGPTSIVTDVSSSARTTSGNSGTLATDLGVAIAGVVSVSAVSGTPTLDIVLQESYDGGTTWIDIWHCERITTTATVIVPAQPINGRRRWVWTIGGTTPSVTFSITVQPLSEAPKNFVKQFYDRTAALIAATSTVGGGAWFVAGARKLAAAFGAGTNGSGASWVLQTSTDKQNWTTISGTGGPGISGNQGGVPMTSSVTTAVDGIGCWARVYCSATGLGVSLPFVALIAEY